MRTVTALTAIFLLCSSAIPAPAGTLDPGSAPALGSGMPSTTDIYSRLDTGAAIAAPGAFKDPAAGPTSGAARTLAEIAAKLPTPDNNSGAAAGDVLAGKTFWGLRTDGTWGVSSGTLPAGASVTGADGSLSVTLPYGLYPGTTTATARDANLVADNIMGGTSIFGTNGKLVPLALAKRVNKTGQTGCWDVAGKSITCAGTGQDGAFQYGIDPAIAPVIDQTYATVTGAYNTPAPASGIRFTDNGDGTVTDNLTALIWLKNANCFDSQLWVDALNIANNLKNGDCNLTDGSSAGQWRLPNINELHSLGPAWPPGAPFTSIQLSSYWSSSSAVNINDAGYYALYVTMGGSSAGGDDLGGLMGFFAKSFGIFYIWPVRGGQ